MWDRVKAILNSMLVVQDFGEDESQNKMRNKKFQCWIKGARGTLVTTPSHAQLENKD